MEPSVDDFVIGEFMSTFAFPTLLHEDPRYFREGEGSFKRRLGHSLASAFVTRTDSGRTTFNWSNFGRESRCRKYFHSVLPR